MRARDILSRPVVTVRRDTALTDAVALLTGHGFAALPVVDERERVVGMLSESDAMAAIESGREAGIVEVAMTTPVQVVEPTTEVPEMVKVMLDHHRRSVPVVEAGVLIGIVARRDLLRALARDEQALEARVCSLLEDYSGSHRQWDVEVVDSDVTIRGICADEAEQRVLAAISRTIPGVGEVRVVDTAAIPSDQ
ncbi:CBS domain-containing protein [Nocardia flavorosea]|uniref:CBS domain-containing protein n=1 Tax=Nocardia flavorosea TaxID=53429 RepID=A0A846YPV2_9NOCA|nr:CBS domain-containing protein [Nocardia flavorosea]NKY59358.1 CBS domain-containing protein [Nocardia flavorosea]